MTIKVDDSGVPRVITCCGVLSFLPRCSTVTVQTHTSPGSTVVSSEDIDSLDDEPYQMVTCPGQCGAGERCWNRRYR